MKIIFDYNKTLFNPDAGAVYPDVFQVLKTLSQKHELFLITLDKPERKSSKAIEEMRPYFKDILFVERKTTTVFQNLVAEEKMAVVVGDRMEDEIRIGIQLRLITIHVKQRNSAQDYSFKQPTYRINSIKEVLEIIENYEL